MPELASYIRPKVTKLTCPQKGTKKEMENLVMDLASGHVANERPVRES